MASGLSMPGRPVRIDAALEQQAHRAGLAFVDGVEAAPSIRS